MTEPSKPKKKAKASQIVTAARQWGTVLAKLEKYEGLRKTYSDQLYPDGATINQENALQKDPKYAKLTAKILHLEETEWYWQEKLRSLSRRLV